jgi:hypothetical protein
MTAYPFLPVDVSASQSLNLMQGSPKTLRIDIDPPPWVLARTL